MTWEDGIACPSCHTNEMVYPMGPSKSPIMLVGDAPGDTELKQGKPFVGPTGGILRTEFGRLGVDYNRMRIMNLWSHAKTDKAECRDAGANKVIQEAQNRKLIMLIGSETVKYFCGVSVEEYNGLIVPSRLLTAIVMVSIQPTIIFKDGGTIGETRFAIKNFCALIERMKLL